MDVAGIKDGVAIMALDVPFSACADTLLVPSIALRQLTDPGTTHKSVFQAAGEGIARSVTNDVIVPVSVETMKAAAAEMQKQSISDDAPVEMRAQGTESAK
jgi:hypothetical protein